MIEHFISPANDLKKLFEQKAKYLIFSTLVYRGANKDWWFLSRHTGQHIFFYSHKGLIQIGNQFNYHCYIYDNYVIYSLDKLNLIQKFQIKIQLNKYERKLMRVRLFLKRSTGVSKDYINIDK